MPIKSANDVQAQVVKAGDKTTIQVLQEGPNFAMRRFVMQPGGGMPEHTNTVEHEQYVLRGCANIGIGGGVYSVKAGDVVFIPEGVPHWYQNVGEEDFEFLCTIPNKPDEIRVIGKEC
ncbi:MAG: cupin domain-containing protein [Anaerolineales bacterium]|nr:cupin domain-containing protein [Anaerolineales bacterium]